MVCWIQLEMLALCWKINYKLSLIEGILWMNDRQTERHSLYNGVKKYCTILYSETHLHCPHMTGVPLSQVAGYGADRILSWKKCPLIRRCPLIRVSLEDRFTVVGEFLPWRAVLAGRRLISLSQVIKCTDWTRYCMCVSLGSEAYIARRAGYRVGCV